MTENTVRQLASAAASVRGLVRNWAHELHAMNDNEEPDPPPAMAARIRPPPLFTAVEPRAVELAA